MAAGESSNSKITLVVSEDVYSREALLRTCYWFTDRCYLFITKGLGDFTVHISAKAGSEESLSAVEGEFQNSLLDFQLRHDIERETGKIRELLVAKAVAEAGTLDDRPPGEANDSIAADNARRADLVNISPAK